MRKNKAVPTYTFRLRYGAGDNHRKGCEDAAGPRGRRGSFVFPSIRATCTHSTTQSARRTAGMTASVAYLDRWADCPTFRHRDITKPSCTGRGNGS